MTKTTEAFSITLLQWLLWPALLSICITVTVYGFQQDQLILYFNVAYAFLAICLLMLERWLPFEREWHKPDGQNIASVLHTLTSKGTVQGLFAASAAIGLAELIVPLEQPGSGIWPREWPLLAQVALGLVTAEFGMYWAHRLGHEQEWLWRFHAIHHSVTKLWFLNTGRFHFVDSLISILAVVGILAALGAPLEVVQWISAMTAFIGILTHCNIDMRCGPLNLIFNTPQLHRWHHSKKLHEGNRNYGENLVLWDMIFGTYFNGDYRPSPNIGIKEVTPDKFIHQLIWPFISDKQRKKLVSHYQPKPFVKEGRGVFPQYYKSTRDS